MTIVNLTGRHQFQWNVNQNKDFLNSRPNGIAICHVVAIHFITLSVWNVVLPCPPGLLPVLHLSSSYQIQHLVIVHELARIPC